MKKRPTKSDTERVAREHPNFSHDDIATFLGISTRTVYRHIGPQGSRMDGLDYDPHEAILSLNKPANILVFDIEVSPLIVASWGLYKQTIYPENVLRDTSILTWAAKYLNSPKVYSAQVTPKEAVNGEDASVIKKLWGLIDKSDIIVGFNSKKFDHKRLSARMVINGFPEPSPYVPLDIFAEMKKKFAFSSNKLDFVNSLLGLSNKTETGFNLWKRCIGGDNEAITSMREYNKNDVQVTEELYHALKSWIKHPSIQLFDTEDVESCPTCGSKNLKPNGFYNTSVARYESLRCMDCQKLARRRTNMLSPDKRKNLLLSL